MKKLAKDLLMEAIWWTTWSLLFACAMMAVRTLMIESGIAITGEVLSIIVFVLCAIMANEINCVFYWVLHIIACRIEGCKCEPDEDD